MKTWVLKAENIHFCSVGYCRRITSCVWQSEGGGGINLWGAHGRGFWSEIAFPCGAVSADRRGADLFTAVQRVFLSNILREAQESGNPNEHKSARTG